MNESRQWRNLGLISLAALTAGTLVPLHLLTVQPGEFGHFTPGPFIVFSLVVVLALGALGAIVLALLHAIERTWAYGFALFVFYWTTVTGLVYPLVKSEAMVAPVSLSIDYWHVAIALILTGALAHLTVWKKFPTLPLMFFAFVVSFTLVPAVPRLYEISNASTAMAQTRAEFLSLSSDDNVIVLSFDELPTNIVRDVLSRRPDLREAFKDFVFFDRAISLAPATVASITAELFGNRNYKEIGDTEDELVQRLDASSLPMNRAAEKGAAVFTFGSFYGAYNLNRTTRLDTGDIYGGRPEDVIQSSATFFEYAVARMATRYGVRFLRATGLTRHTVAALTAGGGSELWERLLDHKGPTWDVGYLKQVLDIEALIENARVGRSGPYVSFMHFVHTHVPVDFDSRCEYRSDDREWHRENQDEGGITGEVHCALTQAARFVDRLRALGVYEQTFLVVKSDHGKPAPYYDSEPHNYQLNGHPVWGVNRYSPLLMVKERGRVAPRTEFVRERVTLGDLSPTLCRQLLGEDPACDTFPGVDLVGRRDVRQNPVVHLNVVKDEESTHAFDTHHAVEINRADAEKTLVDLLRLAENVEVSPPDDLD